MDGFVMIEVIEGRLSIASASRIEPVSRGCRPAKVAVNPLYHSDTQVYYTYAFFINANRIKRCSRQRKIMASKTKTLGCFPFRTMLPWLKIYCK